MTAANANYTPGLMPISQDEDETDNGNWLLKYTRKLETQKDKEINKPVEELKDKEKTLSLSQGTTRPKKTPTKKKTPCGAYQEDVERHHRMILLPIAPGAILDE